MTRHLFLADLFGGEKKLVSSSCSLRSLVEIHILSLFQLNGLYLVLLAETFFYYYLGSRQRTVSLSA
jgi:hypothetical protein